MKKTYLVIHEHGQYDQEQRQIIAAIPFDTTTAIEARAQACVAATRLVRMLCGRKAAMARVQVEQFPETCSDHPLPTREEFARRVWLSLTNYDDDDAVLVIEVPSLGDAIFSASSEHHLAEKGGDYEQVVRRYPVDPSLFWEGIPVAPETEEQKAEVEKRRALLESMKEDFMQTGHYNPIAAFPLTAKTTG